MVAVVGTAIAAAVAVAVVVLSELLFILSAHRLDEVTKLYTAPCVYA